MLRETRPNRVVIEKVSAMPKQGISSTARFTYARGAIYGAVAAMSLSVSFVTPQRCQQYHRIGRGLDDAVRKVMQFYPTLHEHLNRGDQIIPVADMAKLVRDDRFQLCWRQSAEDALGQQQDGSENAEYTRFDQRGNAHDG